MLLLSTVLITVQCNETKHHIGEHWGRNDNVISQ